MKYLKDLLEAFWVLITFKPAYTILPRKMEIALGICVWINILILTWSLLKIKAI